MQTCWSSSGAGLCRWWGCECRCAKRPPIMKITFKVSLKKTIFCITHLICKTDSWRLKTFLFNGLQIKYKWKYNILNLIFQRITRDCNTENFNRQIVQAILKRFDKSIFRQDSFWIMKLSVLKE
jgi:hypothetical protein